MNGFWNALARVNARYLSIGAAALLGLALSAWLVSLAPHGLRREPPLPPAPGPASVAENRADPAAEPPTGGETPSPFESGHLSELVALSDEGLLRWNTPSDLQPDSQPQPPPPREEEKPVKEEEKPPDPPPPRSVKLVYRGMFTRTDGTTVAMIEKDGQGRATSYAAGVAFIDGVRISDIARDHVEVVVGEQTVTLRRGASEELKY